jgi:hypothetical protein
VAELDEDLWEPPEPARADLGHEQSPGDAPSRDTPRGSPPRVVVIDEDADRGPVPEQTSRTSGIGATLEEEGKKPRRWRLFRKGGE